MNKRHVFIVSAASVQKRCVEHLLAELLMQQHAVRGEFGRGLKTRHEAPVVTVQSVHDSKHRAATTSGGAEERTHANDTPLPPGLSNVAVAAPEKKKGHVTLVLLSPALLKDSTALRWMVRLRQAGSNMFPLLLKPLSKADAFDFPSYDWYVSDLPLVFALDSDPRLAHQAAVAMRSLLEHIALEFDVNGSGAAQRAVMEEVMARASLCRPQRTVGQRAAMAIQRVSARARAHRASSFLTAAQKRSLKLMRMNSDTRFNRSSNDESESRMGASVGGKPESSAAEASQSGVHTRTEAESGPLSFADVDGALEEITGVLACPKVDSGGGVARSLHAMDHVTHHGEHPPRRRISLAVPVTSTSSSSSNQVTNIDS